MSGMIVCKAIFLARTRRRMSRKELGKLAGVNSNTILNLENMECIDPRASTLFRICRVLNINILWVSEQYNKTTKESDNGSEETKCECDCE